MKSISTKTGDQGETSLANGQRVAKDSPIMTLIGELDELSSWLGLLAAKVSDDKPLVAQLEKMQQSIYEMSAVVAKSPKIKFSKKRLKELEAYSTSVQATLADDWHTQFLFPGGTVLGGYFDVARAVARRCERAAFGFHQTNPLPDHILGYINRLSDCLYLLRCQLNHRQKHTEKALTTEK